MDHAIAYTWTEHHQLASVKSLAGEFRYQYAENNPALLTQMTSPVHRVATTREPKRDLIAEVRNVGLVGNPQSRRGAEPNPEVERKSVSSVVNPISSYAYTNDGLGRRAQIAQSGAAFETLSFPQTVGVSYNERGEVVGADYVSQSAPAKGAASYRYQYDAIGNRQRHSRQAPDAAKPEITTYEANALNQYTVIQENHPLPAGEGLGEGVMKEAKPTHDLDGNLVENAEFRYEWDSENRLIAAEKKDRTQRVTYVYDSQSRLVARRAQVPARDDTRTWVPAQESHYLYDGWNRLAELTRDFRAEKTTKGTKGTNGTNGAIHTNEPLQDNGEVAPPSSFRLQPSTFLTWGRDLSGSLQWAGGVGGLLAVTEVKPAPAQSASKESPSQSSLARSHYFLYDANGNVTQLVDAAGRLAAHYEYDPFGNVTKTSGGELALSNPWRFSTKAQDEVTGWNYYGFRYYDPVTGRWLSRDPIAEQGGPNLYAFVGNGPVNAVDRLGLFNEGAGFNLIFGPFRDFFENLGTPRPAPSSTGSSPYGNSTLYTVCCCRKAISEMAQKYSIPALAIAGAIAEENETRNAGGGFKGWIDDMMDQALPNVSESELNKSVFSVFGTTKEGNSIWNKAVDYDTWDVGPANIRWKTAKDLHDSIMRNMSRRELAQHLTSCEGTAEYAALYLDQIRQGVDPFFSNHYEGGMPSEDYRIAIYVSGYRQGPGMLTAYVSRIFKTNPEIFDKVPLIIPKAAQMIPGEGQTVINNKSQILEALNASECSKYR